MKQRHKVTWKWHIFDLLLLSVVVGVMKLYRKKKTKKQKNQTLSNHFAANLGTEIRRGNTTIRNLDSKQRKSQLGIL